MEKAHSLKFSQGFFFFNIYKQRPPTAIRLIKAHPRLVSADINLHYSEQFAIQCSLQSTIEIVRLSSLSVSLSLSRSLLYIHRVWEYRKNDDAVRHRQL